MLRQTALFFAIIALSTTSIATLAQDSNPSTSNNAPASSSDHSQAAPIERMQPPTQADPQASDSDPSGYTYNTYVPRVKAGQLIAPTRGTASAEPGVGTYLRVADHSEVRAIAISEDKTQLKLVRGIANISVHNSVDHAQIMIDLPRGEVTLLKDGFYTFNADSDTVRVIKGEAAAYPENAASQKPIKIKENRAITFNGAKSKSFEFHPYEARADLIPYSPGTGADGTSGYQPGPSGYGYGVPYGYGYPYWYGNPYFYGYPFGWGLGLGFYGGWGWGGYGWGRGYGWDRGGWGDRDGWGRGGVGGRGGFGGGRGGGGHGGGGGHR